MFVNEFYFDYYGCPPPTNILNHIKKVSIQNMKFRKMIVIAQRIVYVLYLTQSIGFKNAVSILYYQTFKPNI